MDATDLRARCAALPGVTAEYPFGPDALVMKVSGKLFAIIAEDADPASISLKCEPELAISLRDTYPAVTAGYHLDKRHWNTVVLDGSIPEDEVLAWIEDSYDLVVDKLPRATQRSLGRSV
jgi:predicted DNA-binding protein (MmcQ/YjbR family)